MPVHNAGEYLGTAVDSILNQTHQKLELILIDDHSTDGSISKLNKDSRLRIIKSPSKGIVPALNQGIAESTYPIIARMDGDDISLPNRLSSQLTTLANASNTTIIGAKVEIFSDDHGITHGYRRYESWINQQVSATEICHNFWVESCIPHPTMMMYKSALTSLGGYQDTPWPEDYDLWCRAHLAGYKFVKPKNGTLLRWRDYSKRTSRVDQRYSTDQFLICKAHYLSKILIERQINQCAIWGTGPTGSKLHNLLSGYNIDVSAFIDVNLKLAGRKKYGKPIYLVGDNPSRDDLSVIKPLGLIAVSSWGAREKIRSALLNAGLKELDDFIVVA